jgi:nucleoside-diphosphate-sugar epimerase
MENPKLLITGINGLIGTVLREGLSDSYEIFGLDLSGPFSERVLETDIGEYSRVADVFERCGPFPYVVHLAGVVEVDAEWEPVLGANIVGTRNVFEAARIFGVRRVVFASSNHVTGAYEGFSPHLHLHEEHEAPLISVRDPIRPDGYYGVSKAFGEALARFYCARYGIDFVCLRIGSVRQDDDPAGDARFRKTWLSHRDLIQLVSKSLLAKVNFGIYYGISGNRGAFWDISNARWELGYQPQDDGWET